MAGWIKKQDLIFTALRRIISSLKTNISSKGREETCTPSKWQPEESGCNHIHFGQDRA